MELPPDCTTHPVTDKQDGSYDHWISKNQIVTLSAGEYSDYYYEGPFICNISFNLSKVARAIENDPNECNKPHSLMLKLISSGFLSEIDSREIHLGSNKKIKLSE